MTHPDGDVNIASSRDKIFDILENMRSAVVKNKVLLSGNIDKAALRL